MRWTKIEAAKTNKKLRKNNDFYNTPMPEEQPQIVRRIYIVRVQAV
jgi:hypothetical protein